MGRPVPPSQLFTEAQVHLAKLAAEERDRVQQFGDIRPVISTENWDKRIVAVRDRLYWGNWKYFADFLDSFLRDRFGQDWTQAQNALDPGAQHPITRWRVRALTYHGRVRDANPGSAGVPPNGFMAAYFGFAYDLYVVDDNNDLDERLLARLKNRNQFQGARHELFAEATCLRAGFTVTHEDEADPNRRHVEFIATHKKTGLRLAVEAKSRHRPGVLAQSGVPMAEDRVDFKFSRLLNDAIAKGSLFPLAIFIDTNLPPSRAQEFYGPNVSPPEPSRYMHQILEVARKLSGGRDPFNLLVFTNIPHHYAGDDEPDPLRNWMAYIPQVPLFVIADTDPLRRLAAASELYGNVPNAFPSNE